MCQVTTMIEAQSHHRIPGLERREVRGHVRLRARMRLDVGVVCSEKAQRALDCKTLGDVDELAAAVVAPAGVALGVLVGQRPTPGPRARRGSRSSPRR